MQNILWTKNKVKVIVVIYLFYFDTLMLFTVHAQRNREILTIMEKELILP